MIYIFDSDGCFKGEIEETGGVEYVNSTTIAPDFSKVYDEDYSVTFNRELNIWEYVNLKESEEVEQSHKDEQPSLSQEALEELQESKEIQELYNLALALSPFLKQINSKRTKDAIKSI